MDEPLFLTLAEVLQLVEETEQIARGPEGAATKEEVAAFIRGLLGPPDPL